MTWPTAVFPVSQVGCLPVLVDIDPETMNLDPQAIEAALTPRTRAIMVVHTLGNPCAMPEILALAEQHGLLILEDCCEAHGARSAGRLVGTFGALSTFSFYFSHHMSTIEGGMVCGRQRWLDALRSRRSHGWIRERGDREHIVEKLGLRDGRWVFVSDGYNVRPTEINAAIGRVQLQRLSDFIAERTALRERIVERLQPHAEILQPQYCRPGDLHSAFALALVLRDGERADRDALCAFLESRRIETRPVVGGNLARQPAFEHIAHRAGPLPGADTVSDRGLMLGINPGTTDGQVAYLVDCLSEWCCSVRTASIR